jgi:hypothetical protein
MEHWLECKVSLGQFSGEYAIEAKDYQGKPFSLFVPDGYVECDTHPRSELDRATGWLRVEILESGGRLLLVRLPRAPFENGPSVSVERKHVQSRPARELA